jgi:C1A family cysteine protease
MKICSPIKRSVLLKKLLIYSLITISILINFYKCDLPVHCKREEIEGIWTFRIENEKFDADLKNPKTNCGHGFPDRIEKTVGDQNFKFDSYNEIEINLGSDYKIYNAQNSNRIVGHWTPIYDEAFVAYYKNSVFTAFMKYYLKPGTIPSGKIDNKNYLSNCDKTMIGWYIPDSADNNKNWSCFYGFKSKIKNEFTPNRFLQIEAVSKAKDMISYRNFMEMSTNAEISTDSGLHLMKYDQQELVNEINSMNLSWKADIHEEFKGLSFFELKEKLGLKRSRNYYKNKSSNIDDFKIYDSLNQPISSSKIETNNSENFENISWSSLELGNNIKTKSAGKNNLSSSNEEAPTESFTSLLENFDGNTIGNSYTSSNNKSNLSNNSNNILENLHNVEEDSSKVTDFSTISKYFNKELKEIDVHTLPRNWDWRNIGGVNYVPNPRRQLNCGSCYIFSLVSSLESRLRILTNNKDKTEFSRQFPLSCSFYTEGCQGGYPFLVAKFFNEFEIIPETCAPYSPNNVDCKNICDYTKNPTKYYVSKYEYLGGFYGATSEVDIIKEIRARGPIPGNMTVPWTFSYYKSGIYTPDILKINSGKFSKSTLFDENLSWKTVDHSILLVGYGEENGTKYWIGMNTWGTQWGENGYFKILRGENACNIETMGDAARINFKQR